MSDNVNIPKFTDGHVLVVGDVMLDSYWHGPASRISPEAPVPVVLIDLEEHRVGGAGNVALNASVLGASTLLIGLAGDDPAAKEIESLLGAQGVNCHLIKSANNKTIRKLRVVSRHQQLIRLDFEDHFLKSDPTQLLEVFQRALREANMVILSDYAKGTLLDVEEMISVARGQGVPVIVDPKGADFEKYYGATLITPNLSEFEAVVGSCATEDEMVRKGQNLRESLGLDALLITRSEKGMTLLARDRSPLHLPTHAKDVYDVTGAGDTVIAALGAALAVGANLEDAVHLSNVAAGIVVGKLGTDTVSLPELEQALRPERPAIHGGLLSEEDLFQQMQMVRANGECIVMTNGCFDILHPGHIDYLEKARALGDRLIVAINDDDSVRRLKGSSRPVNQLATRTRMLSALSCVDWVVQFSEDTPERLYCRLLPDILVKGGDYAEDQVAGGACVKAAGGRVQILDFLDGHSTTDLIERIRKGSA